MTTMFYVVPANRFFEVGAPFLGFASRRLADRYIANQAADGDDTDYGIYEIRLVAGSGKMPYGRTMHVVGERRVITGEHYTGGYSAHDDGLGEDTSPYGYGDTPEAAIADLMAVLEAEQASRNETAVSMKDAA